MNNVCDHRIEEAIAFVMLAFRGQVRIWPSQIPASTHSISVGIGLLKAGCSIDTVIGGFCHDLDEDTAIKLPDIAKLFGQRVSDIASACTIDTTLEKADCVTAELLLFEKVLQIALAGDIEPLKIKCADSLDNLRTNADLPANWQVEAVKKGIRWLNAGKQHLGVFSILDDLELVINREIKRLCISLPD